MKKIFLFFLLLASFCFFILLAPILKIGFTQKEKDKKTEITTSQEINNYLSKQNSFILPNINPQEIYSFYEKKWATDFRTVSSDRYNRIHYYGFTKYDNLFINLTITETKSPSGALLSFYIDFSLNPSSDLYTAKDTKSSEELFTSSLSYILSSSDYPLVSTWIFDQLNSSSPTFQRKYIIDQTEYSLERFLPNISEEKYTILKFSIKKTNSPE